MKNKSENLLKSVIILMYSQCIIKCLGLIYSLYLINKKGFGDEGNAIFLSGYQIFVFFLSLSTLGVQNAVACYIAKCGNEKERKKILYSAVCVYVSIAIISGVTLFCISKFLAIKITGIESISYNLRLYAPMLIVVTLESIYTGYFNGIRCMSVTAKIQLYEQVFKTIFTIIFVEVLSKFTQNPEKLSVGATLGIVFSMIVSSLICIIKKKKCVIELKNESKIAKMKYIEIFKLLLKYTVPISLGAVIIGINKNFDSYVIFNFFSKKLGGDSAKRIYGIIASKVDVLISFPLALNSCIVAALIPNISKMNNRNDVEKILEKVFNVSFFIGCIFFGGYLFFSKEIFKILFSNSNIGEHFLKVASFSIIFSMLNQVVVCVLQNYGFNNKVLYSSIIAMLVKFLICLFFINNNYFLEYTTVISNVIFSLISFGLNLKILRKCLNLKVFKGKICIFLENFLFFFLLKNVWEFLVVR